MVIHYLIATNRPKGTPLKAEPQMDFEEFSDRMANDILSTFDPLNETSSFTNGDTGEETVVLPKPRSDHQRVAEYQLDVHTSPEQDLLGEEGVPEASGGHEDMKPHIEWRSSPDATRSAEGDDQEEQTWPSGIVEQGATAWDTDQLVKLEAAQEEERVAATLAPELERPASPDPNEGKPSQPTKDLRFQPEHSVRTFVVEEAPGTDENGEAGNGYLRNVTGSIMGHANLVRKNLEFFSKLPEKQRLSPRVRRLMEEEAPNKDERRKGKIVIYMTSLTAIRETYSHCCTVLEIIHNHNVRYQTKDIYLHPKYKKELKERLQSRKVTVPQVFINGEHIGDEKTVLGLNETGQLQRKLIGFEKAEGEEPCQMCEGRNFIPCLWCRGTKKGTKNRWGSLECTVCNSNGLQHCPDCSDIYKAKKKK